MNPLIAPSPSPSVSLDHIGIIAGEGQFPFLIARAARQQGIPATAIGIRGITSPALAQDVNAMLWVEFGQFGKVIDLLHQAGISKAVMAGRIKHNSIFQLSKIDLRGIKLLARSPSKKADALLGAVTDEFAREKIEIIDSTLLIRECMPSSGLLTPACAPSREVMRDIEFGRPVAKELAGMDIGQTLVVKHQSVVAVEAMEGTDKTIERAGSIAGPGCVVIKVAKPRQDKRFDMPVIGLTTVRKLAQIQAAAIAIPGGQALFFDQQSACALAAENGVTIYAW